MSFFSRELRIVALVERNKSRCQSTFGMRTRNYYVAMERGSFVKARNNELHTLITPVSIRPTEKIEKTFFRLIPRRKWYLCEARPAE